jgi:hypothetical protein
VHGAISNPLEHEGGHPFLLTMFKWLSSRKVGYGKAGGLFCYPPCRKAKTMDSNIIKKDKVTYYKNFIIRTSGELILTPTELSFQARNKKIFSIPVSSILNVRVFKGVGYGVDKMDIRYTDSDKEKIVKFEHIFYMAAIQLGGAARLQQNYFSPWEQAIETARSAKQTPVSDFSALEQLSALKDKGIITEQEFNTKKKQILGL